MDRIRIASELIKLAKELVGKQRRFGAADTEQKAAAKQAKAVFKKLGYPVRAKSSGGKARYVEVWTPGDNRFTEDMIKAGIEAVGGTYSGQTSYGNITPFSMAMKPEQWEVFFKKVR